LWLCTPLKRGRFVVARSDFEIVSPLGFWNARSSSSCQLEIRVYPDLMSERKKIAAVFLNRGNLGIHAHRMIGKGREFEKLRDYIHGDSFEDIHWKATAKRGKPVTKVFQVERTQEVYVAIDSSRLIARQIGADATLERFLASALVLGLATERNGDLFGLITFSDKVHSFIRAGCGAAHYNVCRDAIYTLTSKLVTPDFDALCSSVRLHMSRRSLLIVLTDLGDPMLAESFLKSVELIAGKHVVLVNMVHQPGVARVFSSGDVSRDTSAQITRNEEIYGKLAGHINWHALHEVGKHLEHRGVGFSQIEEAGMTAELVSQYMKVKRRQIL
jgi:uncharacterized protein (DUF58 family)